VNIESERNIYTDAGDLLRLYVGGCENGAKISRVDASRLRMLFSEIMGLDDESVAKALAAYYRENKQRLVEEYFITLPISSFDVIC
jgi:nickel-dependent lactate racemase